MAISLRPESRCTPKYLPRLERKRAIIAPELHAHIKSVCEGREPWPLFIWGPAGVGKTRAALCLVDAVIGLGSYYTVAELSDWVNEVRFQQVFHPGPTGGRMYESDVWDRIERATLVVLDELGARQNVSDAQYHCLKKAIDIRECRPLVAISNIDLRTIAQVYDDRIASRLAAGTIVRVNAQDRRLEPNRDKLGVRT